MSVENVKNYFSYELELQIHNDTQTTSRPNTPIGNYIMCYRVAEIAGIVTNIKIKSFLYDCGYLAFTAKNYIKERNLSGIKRW